MVAAKRTQLNRFAASRSHHDSASSASAKLFVAGAGAGAGAGPEASSAVFWRAGSMSRRASSAVARY